MFKTNPQASMAIIALAFAVWFLEHWNDRPPPPKDILTLKTMNGVWTDPNGPKGNHISFIETKQKDQPKDILSGIAVLYETSGEIDRLFDCNKQTISYGFRSHGPDVIIFVNTGGRNQLVMKLKATDHTHMRTTVMSKNFATQKEDLISNNPVFPPVDLVREKEADFVPNW